MSEDSSDQLSSSAVSKPYGWLIACFVLGATIFAFFASQFAAGLLVGLYIAFNHWTPSYAGTWLAHSVVAQFAVGFTAYALFIAGIWQVMRWMRWKWRDIGFRRPQLVHLLYGLLATIPYYFMYFVALIAVSLAVPSLDLTQRQQIGFESARSTTELILTYISLAVIPPLAEEIAMRGFLYTGLRKWLPKVASALVVSALFGAAHLSEGGSGGPLWIGAVDTFTLSLVLVFLREKTGNLWAGIVLHAAKNSVAFAMLFIVGGR